MKKKKTKPWYKRMEFWGGVLSTVSLGLEMFAPHTAAYKVGVVLGGVLGVLGLKKGYRSDNLPSGLSSMMDKMPNKLTGVKGSLVIKNKSER